MRRPQASSTQWPRCRAALEALTRSQGETWQVGWRQHPCWIADGGLPRRPCGILITSPATGLILAQDLVASRPSVEDLWAVIVKAMQSPHVGEPHRPEHLEMESAELRDQLALRLAALSVEARLVATLGHIDSVMDELARLAADKAGMPALVDVPGGTLKQLASLHRAAAAFYRFRPWSCVPADAPIELESAAFTPRQYHAVIMGQMRQATGLALYDDWEGLQDIIDSPRSDEENARLTSAISFIYSPAHEISPADLHAVERHGWEIAADDAYLWVMRMRRGQDPVAPSAHDLLVLERALFGLPEFLRNVRGTSMRIELRFPEPLEPLFVRWA